MIRAYLRHRRAVLALYILAAITYPAIQALHGLPLEAPLYGLLVITFVLLVACCVDFFRFATRAHALDAVIENLSDAAQALPEAIGPVEARYHTLVEALYQLQAAQAEALARGYGEQLDYYTMWVHQIKTPIAAMRLSLQGGGNPALLEAELLKVERYVEMALQFIRLENIAADLVIEECAIAPLVNTCVKRYAPLFIGKRLRVEIEATDFAVVTDSKWLAFIVEQLLSNAIKYTDKGHVRISGGGTEAARTLTIEDTGSGIRPEDLPRVFSKGYTGTSGRIDRRASGLGLYMAGRVATQLGIRIYPESTPGKGTRMTLVFPRRDANLQ